MADYRELSQGYARAAINAAILINGGAAIATLSQLEKFGAAVSVRVALVAWALGVLGGAVTWVLGFISTRLVDKVSVSQIQG
jgi:membrane protein YqaA with SNARE-associated domain